MKRVIVAIVALVLTVGCFAQIQHNEPDGFTWIEFETTRTGATGSPEWHNAMGAKNSYGQIVVPAQYMSVEYILGYFRVTKYIGNKHFYYGLHDKYGREIVPVGDHYISSYFTKEEIERGVIIIGHTGKSGAVDLSTGEFVVPLVYDLVAFSDNDDLLAWDNSGNMHKFPWTKKKSQNQSNSDEVAELRRQVEELKRQVNGQQNSGGNAGAQSVGAQPHQEFRPCFSCGGTRKCVTCVGDGIYTIWTGNRSSSCTCSGCNGSGICNFCHGTGGTYETVYY